MNNFTTIDEAINFLADVLCLSAEGATWVYENSDCPDWDDEAFTSYDFLGDPKVADIPVEHIARSTLRFEKPQPGCNTGTFDITLTP